MLFILYLILVCVEHGFHAGGILWLADWSDSTLDDPNEEATMRLGMLLISFSLKMF